MKRGVFRRLLVARRLAFSAVFLAIACCRSSAGVKVDYTLTIRPNLDKIHVSAQILNDPDSEIAVAMPVWLPGYYRRTDQWKGVSNVSFSHDGETLTTAHPTDALWTTSHTPNEPLTVSYDVKRWEYGFDSGDTALTMGQMGVHVDGNSAFVHPGVACMYVTGHKDATYSLRLDLPSGWKATTPLTKSDTGAFVAPDYDTLNDSPIQAGRFKTIPFSARGHGFEIITTGHCRVSDTALIRVCRSVAEEAIDLFEGWAPFDNYQFQFHFPPKRSYPGPGLEHRSSCVIVFSGDVRDEDFMQRDAHIVAHEFLHAWNVKALRPQGLGPFDYQRETPTPSLWLVEGITDYFAYVIGARAGLWTADSVLVWFSALWSEYTVSEGRLTTSLADSSLHVWESLDASSSGYGGTNYYTKGLLVGWLLDIQIRAATGGKRSLDDAMRLLVRKYAVKGAAYPPDALLEAIKTATGVDLTDSYNAMVYSKSELPVGSVLRLAGAEAQTNREPNLMLGVNLERGAREPRVVTVDKGSAADEAHIAPGDVLLTIDGLPVQIGKRPLLAGKTREIGDRVPVIVLRDGERELVTVIIQGSTRSRLARTKNLSPAQQVVWDGIWKPSGRTAN